MIRAHSDGQASATVNSGTKRECAVTPTQLLPERDYVTLGLCYRYSACLSVCRL